MDIRYSILKGIIFCLSFVILVFLIFVATVFKYKSEYDKLDVLQLAKIASPNLHFNEKIDILPMFCLPDNAFYHAFGCGNVQEEAYSILSERFASEVLANMDNDARKESSSIIFDSRALFRLSEAGDLEAQPVDIPEYNNKLEMSFDCDLVKIESDNVFRLPLRLSVCSYRGQFVYSVLSIKNLYGFPPNPIGEALLPIRAVDWRVLRGLE
ncbi:hypothetical protein G6L89_007075 [Agrobacterium fabrum]|uniref:hypothetical protein n=1 Tax=Agrobacterium fabrum TaxID=1176649 RepID=UPI00157185D6|nr:hypothetical protein [Agrobacterium fabrum]NTB07591.1 hypothetical protein [Agrobacterium fabrum]